MKFVIQPAARSDILDQLRYFIDEDVPHLAKGFIEAVEETITRLCRQPNMGSPKKLKNPRLRGLRMWPVKGFEAIALFYLCTNGTLRVIRVLHGKREVDRILSR